MNDIAILAPVLTALGACLKGWSKSVDRMIPMILALAGGLLACIKSGWTGDAFTLGLVAGLGATGINQQYRQFRHGHGGAKSAILLSLVACLMVAGGCARFTARASEDANGVRYTRVKAYTLFDSKSELGKLSVAQGGKTNAQSIGLGALNQTSSSTNTIRMIELMLEVLREAK